MMGNFPVKEVAESTVRLYAKWIITPFLEITTKTCNENKRKLNIGIYTEWKKTMLLKNE